MKIRYDPGTLVLWILRERLNSNPIESRKEWFKYKDTANVVNMTSIRNELGVSVKGHLVVINVLLFLSVLSVLAVLSAISAFHESSEYYVHQKRKYLPAYST